MIDLPKLLQPDLSFHKWKPVTAAMFLTGLENIMNEAGQHDLPESLANATFWIGDNQRVTVFYTEERGGMLPAYAMLCTVDESGKTPTVYFRHVTSEV
jgi:hypothetical protein